MIIISGPNIETGNWTQDEIAIAAYAAEELLRLLKAGVIEGIEREHSLSSLPDRESGRIELVLEPTLAHEEMEIKAERRMATIACGSPATLLHAVYTFCEKLDYVFEMSGERVPQRREVLDIPLLNIRHTPTIRERGIRMHLNFVQDQSFFSEDEFAAFIDNMARQKWNYVCFHMYTPQQWFPFEYEGIRPLEHSLGNLNRKPIDPAMTGRDKVQVQDHWFPRELEPIRDPEELLTAMYERYCRMMRRSRERGIRNCVSFEPESVPIELMEQLERRAADTVEAGQTSGGVERDDNLVDDWQEGWSGVKLAQSNLRHPLMSSIAVARCLQCIDAFEDLDDLQLISREGTAWRPGEGESYEAEIARLTAKFSLPLEVFDLAALGEVVQPDEGPEMNPKAHPYWTVLPGSDYYPTVIGSLRYVEFALEVLADPAVREKLERRGIAATIALYNPNPRSVELMMAVVSQMLPAGMRFHCIADYGASSIAEQMPNWQPLKDHGIQPGVISWLEFDGTMMLAQDWGESLRLNVEAAVQLGADTIYFNHWRVRSLEHNTAIAAACCWDLDGAESFERDYFRRLFGTGNTIADAAHEAYRLLEQATLYSKQHNYNIGFTSDWVFNYATDAPGYSWRVLAQSAMNFREAADAFETLHESASRETVGADVAQAAYMRDLCLISAVHIEAVNRLQRAKLPLFGYKAWPADAAHAAWPAPDQLLALLAEAEEALRLEQQYMETYAPWVQSCDEQGQLVMHHQGVIEPLTEFVRQLRSKYEEEHLFEQSLAGRP